MIGEAIMKILAGIAVARRSQVNEPAEFARQPCKGAGFEVRDRLLDVNVSSWGSHRLI
jgi:hypothetical protein